ncbi:MAG: dihydrofolate reductase [Candidatus Moranbacteria bacterium]|nr:dihydrofolate reductase [Candidatus Moranbacteria bacterium]
MNVTLYMAVSADGFIARKDDSTPWSDEEWAAFLTEVHSVGNMIIGRRTFESIVERSSSFEEYGSAVLVVVSESMMRDSKADSNVLVVDSPEAALRLLDERGFSCSLLAGGATLNAAFLKSGLVDTLVLDVEPRVLGSGLRLFSGEISERGLRLDEVRKLSGQSVQLRYSVVK